MLTALLAARNVMGEDHDVWNVNVERSYHEDFKVEEEKERKKKKMEEARRKIRKEVQELDEKELDEEELDEEELDEEELDEDRDGAASNGKTDTAPTPKNGQPEPVEEKQSH